MKMIANGENYGWFFLIDPHRRRPTGDGILDLDVHLVQDRRARGHGLHRTQEAEPHLSPLVNSTGMFLLSLVPPHCGFHNIHNVEKDKIGLK